jgi:hypothetical protein
MPTYGNPASLDNENRVIKTAFVSAENLKEYTEFPSKNQRYSCFYSQYIVAPDEEVFPIICQHWQLKTKQQILAEFDAGRGGVA